MRLQHFAIEQKRNVGVKFFLQGVQPLIGAIPRPILLYDQKDLIVFLIDGKKIDHARMLKTHLTILITALLLGNASAQFTPAFLQNESYWGDGKSEFNIYAAEISRGGTLRPCEVLHIYTREKLDGVPVLRLNQIFTAPTGLTVQQQMHSNYWRIDNGQLLKFCLTSSDSSNNIYKEGRRNAEQFICETRGSTATSQSIAIPANGYFYEELPWLVRTLDFSKTTAPFEIQIASENLEFKPAKVSLATTARTIEVRVGEDQFILDRDFPNLLREWKAADGSHLKMKRNLKVDYSKYEKPGDRERALNDPMLRLPD